MAYFDGIKKGDKIWNFTNGWYTVKEVDYDLEYPIRLIDSEGFLASCNMDGKAFVGNQNQSFFWDEFKFEIPKKPKLTFEQCVSLVQKKDFVAYESNFSVVYNTTAKIWTTKFTLNFKEPYTTYYTEKNAKLLADSLNENEVKI